MVTDPVKHFPQIAKAGGDSVTFHHEVVQDVRATVAAARELGLGTGLAFNPETDPADVAAAADGVDIVLCMSIHPGYSGQAFMPDALGRIARLRELLPPDVPIQVDGGIGAGNIASVRDAGAALFVAGSSIFDADDAGAA